MTKKGCAGEAKGAEMPAVVFPSDPSQRFARHGVTLVEILISLMILVLVTSALANGTNYLTRRLVRAKNATVARNLAWKKLAEARSRKIAACRNSGIFGREFPGYEYSEEVKPANIAGQALPGLYAYDLTVTWPEAWQKDQVTFSTLIADYFQPGPSVASATEVKSE